MQPYIDTECASIHYDADNHALVTLWKMPPLPSELREHMLDLLSAMEHFKTGKVVADTAKMGTLHPVDQEWASTEWASMAVQSGYSHAAILLSKDIFSQMAIEDTMNSAADNVTFSYFENIETALAWIKSV